MCKLYVVFPVIVLLAAQAAHADNDFIIYSPYVVEGQSEVETYTYAARDARQDLNGATGTNVAVAHAFTDWWKTEVYVGEFSRAPGGISHPAGYEWENIFQLSSPGEYWVDSGLLASYAYNKQAGAPNVAEFGPLLEKHSGHIDQRLNLIWGKQTGTGSVGNFQFRSAYSIRYNIDHNGARFAPGAEVYYRPNDHALQVGPVLYGELRTANGSEMGYSLGIVFGANQGAANATLLGRLEFEFM